MPFLNMPGAALKMSYVKWNRLFNPELITASSPVQVNTSAQGCRDAGMQRCRDAGVCQEEAIPGLSSQTLHCTAFGLRCTAGDRQQQTLHSQDLHPDGMYITLFAITLHS